MSRNLALRIAAGVVFLPVLFFVVRLGGWAYTILLALIVLIGAWEWWRLGRHLGPRADLALVVIGALGLFQGGCDPHSARLAIGLAYFLLIALLATLRRTPSEALPAIGHLLLGAVYVGLLPAFLVRMRALPDGRAAVYLAYLTVFVCDTAAYAAGSLCGRRPLWRRVSPKKTWEGAGGGLIGAIGAALLAQATFAGFLSVWEAVGWGGVVGVVGQLGDLTESFWKRIAGIKDSSGLIPGHGGVLDRFDNLHFVAPVLYTYLTIFT